MEIFKPSRIVRESGLEWESYEFLKLGEKFARKHKLASRLGLAGQDHVLISYLVSIRLLQQQRGEDRATLAEFDHQSSEEHTSLQTARINGRRQRHTESDFTLEKLEAAKDKIVKQNYCGNGFNKFWSIQNAINILFAQIIPQLNKSGGRLNNALGIWADRYKKDVQKAPTAFL